MLPGSVWSPCEALKEYTICSISLASFLVHMCSCGASLLVQLVLVQLAHVFSRNLQVTRSLAQLAARAARCSRASCRARAPQVPRIPRRLFFGPGGGACFGGPFPRAPLGVSGSWGSARLPGFLGQGWTISSSTPALRRRSPAVSCLKTRTLGRA